MTIKLRDTSKLKDRQLGYGTVKHETLYQKHESFMWYRKSHLLTKVGLPEFLSLLFPEPFAYKYFSVCNPCSCFVSNYESRDFSAHGPS